MQLYQIKLPVKDNAGKATLRQLNDFEAALLDIVGGYTAGFAERGAWRDPKTGKVFDDEVVPYTVATDATTFDRVTHTAFRLFPDQLAIFTAHLGTAEIVDRAERYRKPFAVG